MREETASLTRHLAPTHVFWCQLRRSRWYRSAVLGSARVSRWPRRMAPRILSQVGLCPWRWPTPGMNIWKVEHRPIVYLKRNWNASEGEGGCLAVG